MKRILVVDDSKLILTQIGDVLVTLGYEVAGSASSGAKAVQQAKHLHPDIVLMDVVMPGRMDGIEAARQIRTELDIPVIMVTDYEDEESIDRIRQAQVYGHIMKPIRPLELKASLEIALEKRESEGRFRDLYREVVENTSDLIYVVDGQGIIQYVNDRIVELVGYTQEDAIGKNFASFLTPDSLTYSIELFGRHLKGGDVGPFELEVLDTAGDVHIIEISERLVWDKDRVVEVHGIGRDVTERKEAEEALRESELKYRTILNTIEEGYYEVDIKGSFTFFNDSMRHMLGYEKGELEGLNYREYMSKENAEKVFLTFNEVFRTEIPTKTLDWQLIRKDGSTIDIETSISLKKTKSGTAAGFYGIARDITERKKAEGAIRDNEQRSKLLFEAVPDLIFVLTRDGTCVDFKADRDDDLVIPRSEIIGKSIGDIGLSPEHLERAFTKIERAITTKTVQEFEYDLTLADGIGSWSARMVALSDNEVLALARNITERKKAEEAITESELKYRTLAENTQEAIIVLQDNVIKFLNPATLDISGYAYEEMVSKPFMGLIHPDDRQKVAARYVREVTGESLTNPNMYRVIRKDGTVRWVLGIGISITWEGRPASLSFITDITERKEAEEALRESERHYRLLAENIDDVIVTFDMNLNCTYVSPSITRLQGLTVDEAMTSTPAANLAPKSLELAMNVFGEELEKEATGSADPNRSVTLELEQYHKDGSTIWTESTFSPLRDERGKPIGIIGITRDIRRRKETEKALKESEAKFRGVFETSRDFMYISSIDGKIIEYNPSAKEFFGYSDEEITDLSILDLYQDPEDRVALLEKLKAEGFVQNYELQLKKKDGSLIEALATIVVRRDSDGNLIGFQGSVKDITQMRRLEQQLVQAEKLSGLGTMISGIAHELNNPLTAIMGNAELLSMGRTITNREKRSLDVILQESSRAAKIVNGLLAFAREHKPERRMINVNDVVRQTLSLREYNLRVNNTSVQLSLSEKAPPTLADPHQLQQVFTNMISNASDALADMGGGKLTIRTKENEKTLRIEFEDDGPGIKKENLKKVFDPFFTTKDVGKGTGLGLSMAYGIIEEHGGRIEVESEPGRGAKFTIVLPVHKGKTRSSGKETEYVEKKFSGKSILVVDDEAVVRDFLSELLLKEGCFVQAASTAQDAISLMKDRPFDAVIADIRMPGMDGKELYAHILKEFPSVSGKVLFITGDTLSEEIQVFLRVSNTNAITKPFKIDEFLSGLNRIFEE